MLRAIIAAVATVIIVAVIVGVVLYTRANATRGHAMPTSIQSIGDSQAPLQSKEGRGRATVPSGAAATGNEGGSSLADRLKGRFTALTVVIAAVFGSLTVKLWSMQILSSETYAEQSEENQITTIKTAAPRGRIFDTEGYELVSNAISTSVMADADVADDRTVLVRLSALLGLPYNVVRSRANSSTGGAQALRTIVTDAKMRDVAFISEHADSFPGITIQETTHRSYPYKALAAQVIGYTGTASESELENPPEGLDYESGDEVGKAGIEAAYESVLSGTHGEREVVASVDGTVREVRSEIDPTQGNDVYLTISATAQKVAEDALAAMIAPKGSIGTGKGVAGAIVGMDVATGDIKVMANFPTFDPTDFVGGITQDVWDEYTNEDSEYPLMNRAIAGTYPAASTYKAFTGLAGLKYGFADDTKTWNCEGTWTGFGEDFPQHCWDLTGHGYLTFKEGVQVSCDVVFYNIAKDFYDNQDEIGTDAMQDFIKEFGFGAKTGIDIDGEAEGVVPTPEWKQEMYVDAPEQATWRGGDISNMVIGQGDVLVTPLQIAHGYAAVATGKLVTPNLLKEVRNSAGEVVLTHTPADPVALDVDEKDLEIMREALNMVSEYGSVPTYLADFDWECGCKTGTGEATSRADCYAWFVCYAPFDDPKYVVACLIEEGGSGAAAACTPAAKVMDCLLKMDAGTFEGEPGAVTPILDKTTSSDSSDTYTSRTD